MSAPIWKPCLLPIPEPLNLNPSDADAYHARGYTKAQLGQYQAALVDYDKAIALNPHNIASYNNRGYTKQGPRSVPRRPDGFGQSHCAGPGPMPVPYSASGPRQAYPRPVPRRPWWIWTKAIALNPTYAHAYHDRGTTKATLGRMDEARTDYEHARAVAKRRETSPSSQQSSVICVVLPPPPRRNGGELTV